MKEVLFTAIKPSNIFVLPDDSVKLIDFGVARWPDSQTVGDARSRGTLLYMSPEQIQYKPITGSSDIFALGVTCYEALTGTTPFLRETEDALAVAICEWNPPPLNSVRPDIPFALCQAVHMAMAKSPAKRYLSAYEFGQALQKSLHTKELYPLPKPRLDSARQAYEEGEYEFAEKSINELMAEGGVHPETIELARRTVLAAREKRINQALLAAQACLDGGETTQAFRRVNEVLELDPQNSAALSLHRQVRLRMEESDLREKLTLAREHLANARFDLSRQEAGRILKAHPGEARAQQMLADIDREEREYSVLREERETLYKAALSAYERRDISAAMSRVERLRAMSTQYRDPSKQVVYEGLYQRVWADHEAIREGLDLATQLLDRGESSSACAVCNALLERFPRHTNLLALKWRAQELQQQARSGRIAEIDRMLRTETDLGKQIRLLDEAVRDHPEETHFQLQLAIVRDRHRHMEELVAAAREHEERQEYAEAWQQWQAVQMAYSAYPGLALELDRVRRFRDEQERRVARQRAMSEIDWLLEAQEFERACEAAALALETYPDAAELREQQKQAQRGFARRQQANQLLIHGRSELDAGRSAPGLASLREAAALDPVTMRVPLAEALGLRADHLLNDHPMEAEGLLREALTLDPRNSRAQGLLSAALQQIANALVDNFRTRVRQAQTEGRYREALDLLEDGLAQVPGDPGLIQIKGALVKRLEEEYARDNDLFRKTLRDSAALSDLWQLREQRQCLEAILAKHPDAEDLRSAAREFFARVDKAELEADRGAVVLAPDGLFPLPAIWSWKSLLDDLQRQPVLLAGLACLAVAISFAAIIGLVTVLWPRPASPRPFAVYTGSLQVETIPPHAKVRIDGRDYLTPTATLDLTPHTYALEVSLPGYETDRSSVDVIPRQLTEKRITLNPLLLRLTVRGNRQAFLFHNGEKFSYLPGVNWERAGFRSGPHEIRGFVANQIEFQLRFVVGQDGASSGFTLMSAGMRAFAVSRFGMAQTECKPQLGPTMSRSSCVTGNPVSPVPLQRGQHLQAPGEHGIAIYFEVP